MAENYYFTIKLMAETRKGQKYNRIPGYIRKIGGQTQHVKSHARSNPRTSKGASKGR